jgi:hypothetical protein
MKEVKLDWKWPYGGPKVERSPGRVRIVAEPGDATRYDLWCFQTHSYAPWMVVLANFRRRDGSLRAFTWDQFTSVANIMGAFGGGDCGTPRYTATACIHILRSYLSKSEENAQAEAAAEDRTREEIAALRARGVTVNVVEVNQPRPPGFVDGGAT